MPYVVDLEAFHGPLDLLLYLVEKSEIDIYDIPIAAIAEQYLEYLRNTGHIDLEQLGDFLLMASYLLNLKSRLILPNRVTGDNAEDGDEAIDPRTELVQKLLDYKKFKAVSDRLAALYEGELPRIYYRNSESGDLIYEELSADLKALVKAYQNMVQQIPVKSTDFNLALEDIKVEDKMDDIVRMLKKSHRVMVFQEMFRDIKSRREALALFLALLELLRLQRVRAVQEQGFGQIVIQLKGAKKSSVNSG